MLRRIKGRMIPAVFFAAVLITGLVSAGCEGYMEDTFEPSDSDEAEEQVEENKEENNK